MTLIADSCTSAAPDKPLIEETEARRARLGELEIRRALPIRERRMVGPWCFLDRYGPLTFRDAKPMDLGAHPHIGLQTVSWLLEGEIVHHDSLGYESLLRPGAINLMTAGAGIAHAEESPRVTSGRLSGVQLWIAMPDATRHGAPAFEHRDARLGETKGATMAYLLDEPTLVGADITIGKKDKAEIPLAPAFEHAVFVLEGTAQAEGRTFVTDSLYYLGTGRGELLISSSDGARLLLIGGVPFGETILMWWNFVARTHEEIVEAAEAWTRGERFGVVRGAQAPPMPAPPLRGRAKPPAAS